MDNNYPTLEPSIIPVDMISEEIEVACQFVSRVLGGVPKGESALEWFIKTKFTSDEEAEEFRRRVKDGELTDEELDEIKNTNWTTFERSPEGGYCCVWNGNFKKMIVESIAALSLINKGAKTPDGKPIFKKDKQHGLQIAVNVKPQHILINVDGKPTTQPNGFIDKPKNLKDKFGNPASALGRHDYIDRGTFTYTLVWTKNEFFTADDMLLAICQAQTASLGACRSQGFGRYNVIGLKINGEKVTPEKMTDVQKRIKEALQKATDLRYERKAKKQTAKKETKGKDKKAKSA